MQAVVGRLEGAFTLLAVHSDAPDVVVGARRNSPLVVGLGEGENFLGSDVAAFVAYTQKALSLGQDQIVTITPDLVEVITFEGEPVTPEAFTIDWDASAAEKGGWSSFMAKEISEEPEAVANTLRGRITADGRRHPAGIGFCARGWEWPQPHHLHRLWHGGVCVHAGCLCD
jgi:glucosamine--fructose-6-phosphate aminotransferase (isomerizing)